MNIGIYIYDRTKSISVDEIIQNSDKAMYMAKNSGKNRYYFSKE